jgi:hypothetical protein
VSTALVESKALPNFGKHAFAEDLNLAQVRRKRLKVAILMEVLPLDY